MRRRRPSSRGLIALTIVALGAVASVQLVTSARGPASSPVASAIAQAEGSPAPAATDAASPIPGLPTSPPGAAAAAWRVTFAWHVPVLMYHVIATSAVLADAKPGLTVAPELFAAQLAAARNAGWTTITAATLAKDMAAGIEPARRTFVITIDDGHEDGFTQAFPILQEDGFVATYYVPTERIGHPGFLTPSEIQQMAGAGMEIADHTVNHVRLASVPPVEATFQIDSSEAVLTQLLGARPTTFAYPFGSHDPSVVAEVGQAGFLLAFTTVDGCSETIANRLEAPRLRVGPATLPQTLVFELDRCSGMLAWG